MSSGPNPVARLFRLRLFPTLPVLLACLFFAAFFAAGCGGDEGDAGADRPPVTAGDDEPGETADDTDEPVEAEAEDDVDSDADHDAAAGVGAGDVDAGTAGTSAKLWFTSGEQFVIVDRDELRVDSSDPESLAEVVRLLMAGPLPGDADLVDTGDPAESGGEAPEVDTEVQTQIPDGVEVEGVTLSDDGVVVVRLSDRFLDDVATDPDDRLRADREKINARLGQVTYTLTQFDGVEKVRVRSGGERVRVQAIEPEAADDVGDDGNTDGDKSSGGGSKGGGASLGSDADAGRDDFQKPSGKPKPKPKPKPGKEPGADVGASNLTVRQVQKELARLRYLPKSAVDGVNGYRTSQAVIAFQSWEGLLRDGVVGPQTTAALLAAKRPKPNRSGPARRIEVYNDKGVTLLVEGGKTKRAIHVSTGKPDTPTPTGTYTVFRKELQSWSYPFSVWLPYASYFNQGIAFHEYADVPTYPASAGCVRVPAPEAKLVYNFASMGTTVIVY